MSWKFLNKKPVSKERMYQVIQAPVITEKATMGSENNQVTFKVATDANKHEIKAAVENLFDVKVKAVNTLNVKGKVKRFRGIVGKRAGFKKAVVTLAEGDSIDVTTGL
ncbi:50S ribosomal protein L23 [Aestuariispira ectoiniformans]|uniref:50S ribosomal protein L23 n=1 Tax=Aestuariispira ectoiniformans TaxID=2775080 RepID=UPI00223C43C7|nr:50S ribosomal protein L23 [Aestuariispira ectoiniformans]